MVTAKRPIIYPAMRVYRQLTSGLHVTDDAADPQDYCTFVQSLQAISLGLCSACALVTTSASLAKQSIGHIRLTDG